jgi:twitching motility protein PilT
MSIKELLSLATHQQASDLHIAPNSSPILRINGNILKTDFPPVSAIELKEFCQTILHIDITQTDFYEADCAFTVIDLARFRINIFRQNFGIAAAIRILPKTPPTIASLNLPEVFYDLCNNESGLILITGATGSGKTTSLAAMLQSINVSQSKHIISIEDPIEYIFMGEQSLISQREIGRDCANFHNALRSVLREDPDIIVVTELRDLETIRLALTAAETGHLVCGTLHSCSAPKSIDRILDSFPTHEKDFMRNLLADSLRAVIAQKMIHTEGKYHPVFEIMINNSSIRNLIRDNKINQIYSAMQTGKSQGMQLFSE